MQEHGSQEQLESAVRMRTPVLKAAVLIMGASGIVAQIVLLRELLVSFLGNELTLGVILANWLILEAMGSLLVGRSAEKRKRQVEIFVSLQLLFSVTFPAMVYLSRVFKHVLLTTPGEGIGLAGVFFCSLVVLLPVSLPHGALFPFGCKLYSQRLRGDASTIGSVYILETIGSIAGGLLLTFLLLHHLHSFQIALIISVLNGLASLFLLWPKTGVRSGVLPAGLFVLAAAAAVLFGVALLTPVAGEMHRSSVRWQWRNLEVVHHENSVYGNVTVTKREGQFTFFTDGVPSLSAPDPDIASLEDRVHFSMLFHESPESVLVLSGGAGGMIHEILKHPVRSVDYVELDPLLLKLVQEYATPLTRSELTDGRVTIHHTDGRFFIHRTRKRFDVIFVGLAAPQDLQTNRLFSSEFFTVARSRMNPGGIIVFSLPGSLTYLSPELRDLNGCILDTVKGVFPHVRIIPGDENLYLASGAEALERVGPEEVVARLHDRRIETNLFSAPYIEYRLDDRRLQWFTERMEDRKATVNTDFRPVGTFYYLAYWNALFSPYLSGMFRWFEGFHLYRGIALTAVATLFLAVFFSKIPSVSRAIVPCAVLASGFAGMIFELAILFAFQTIYGYLYYQIGLLLTVFLAGAALGGFHITRRLERIKGDCTFFLKTELGMIAFALVLPFVLSVPAQHLDQAGVPSVLYALFLVMSLISGVLLGLQFPVANKIYLNLPARGGVSVGRTSGLLYGTDLLGGFFGGLLGGFLLLPLLGLHASCFLLAVIKGSSFLLVLLLARMSK